MASTHQSLHYHLVFQEDHHRITTFKEEYVNMLKLGMVEYDDRYLW